MQNSIPNKKSMVNFKKRGKKVIYCHFLVKIKSDQLSSTANLWNACHKISKNTLPEVFKMFEIKSHQRRAFFKLSGAICASKAQAQA